MIIKFLQSRECTTKMMRNSIYLNVIECNMHHIRHFVVVVHIHTYDMCIGTTQIEDQRTEIVTYYPGCD